MKHPRHTSLVAAIAALLATSPAQALDIAWSGFATLGYARSDSVYTYQRVINEDGTVERDTLVAGQADLRLTPEWAATAQIKLAPSADSDDRWSTRAAWAFVAWRPNNDWLVRAGKMRLPLYLYSESLDVGVSHDMARLPHEMYSLAPTNDFTGMYATRSVSWGTRDISLDAYAGKAKTALRIWLRDGAPPYQPAGPLFRGVDVEVQGLVLTSRDTDVTWRLGLHSTRTTAADGHDLPRTYPRVDIGPGIGYWQVNDAFPGPGIPKTARLRNLIITMGAEWQLAPTWRVSGEFVRMRQQDTALGSDSRAGYIALFKHLGAFTPYVSLARQRSTDALLKWRTDLTGAALPAQIPGAAQINAVQRMAGESVYAFDQRSTALGLSYDLSPTAKLKAEWMRTRVGTASAHFDVPAGLPDARDLSVDTLSVNYSVAF